MEGARSTGHQTSNQNNHRPVWTTTFLRPEQMRQLYQTCVAPVVDYASTVWHDPLRDKTHLRHLNTVQRTLLIRILSAFRTVATSTLEVEAYVLPTHLRLRHRAQRTIARLHTLPRDHPV